jgi:hypothetical protein
MEVGDVIPSGCGALAAWSTRTLATNALECSTRLVGFDGSALGSPIAHPSLGSITEASASISLATNGSGFGALEVDETGSRFLAMDPEGHEQGAAISLGADNCMSLEALDGAWSFLRGAPSLSTPGALDVLDPATGKETTTPLAIPAGQALWERLRFDDGSFLIDSFREDSTGADTTWLAPFAKDGAAIGPQLVVPDVHTAPVWLVVTKDGALAAWWSGSFFALPIDRFGAPTGPLQTVVADKDIYELVVLPVPDGDVLAAWTELEPSNDFATYVVALAPDGTPRGPATLVASPAGEARLRGVVEPNGARALLVTGMSALPLTCVH